MFGSLGTGHHNHHVSTRQMSVETLEEEDKVRQRGETGDNIQKVERRSVTYLSRFKQDSVIYCTVGGLQRIDRRDYCDCCLVDNQSYSGVFNL